MTDPITFAKAIADDTRQQIMRLCCCERLTVSEITAKMQLTQPTISHHLAILRDADLVIIERQGRETYYSLNQACLTVCCGQLMMKFAPNQQVTETVKNALLMPD